MSQEAAARLADLRKAIDWLRKIAVPRCGTPGLLPSRKPPPRYGRRCARRATSSSARSRLAGAGTQRRVALDVTVDGAPGAALSVMSQGELHALGLALFLPRATAADSPFGFVVIDDPVQSMDPAKVDGLARVLSSAAASRQVVVFTHDDRLPAALRQLQLPATVWAVTRRERSVVSLKKVDDPVVAVPGRRPRASADRTAAGDGAGGGRGGDVPRGARGRVRRSGPVAGAGRGSAARVGGTSA